MCRFQRTSRFDSLEGLSPVWLPARKIIQPVDSRQARLPPAARLVGVTGFEPVTLRLSSACSNQLSYTPAREGGPQAGAGGAEESRTPDL